MLPQTSLLLFLLVAGSQCAPAKMGAGINVGGSGEASLTGGLSAQASLKDPMLIHGGATALVGASGKGGLHGGAYGYLNDKVVGADGEVKGNVGGLAKSVFEGDIGVDKHGNAVIGGTNRLTGAGEFGGNANVRAATNEDALTYIQMYGGKSALDDLHKIY